MSAAETVVVLVVFLTFILPSLASGGRSLLLQPFSNHSAPSLGEASAVELLPDIPGEASAPSDEHNTLGLDSLVSTAVQQSKLDVLLHPVQDQVLVTGASPRQDTPIKEEAETVDASTREVITSLPPSTPVLLVGLGQSASKPREATVRYQVQAPPHLNSFGQKAAVVSEALSKSKTASQPVRQDRHHLHEHHEHMSRE